MIIDTKRLATDAAYSLLASRYSYDPETGVIYGSRGKPLTTKNSGGYIRVRTRQDGKYVDVLGHRLAFLLMTGQWPTEVDHINGVVDDNRWDNLRDVSHQQNMRNAALRSKNRTGVSGVLRRDYGGIRSTISVNGKKKELGTFDNLFDAICARKSAEVRFGYHINHGRVEP